MEDWYEKASSFERSRRKAIKEFRKKKSMKNVRKKPVLDIPRQDPNVMEVNKCREMRRCYNCEEIGHLTARCSKLRKEKREEVRITKNAMEDFFLGRE